MRLVVDASVAIKWVVSEVDSSRSIAIRRHELIAPELIFSERCNALWNLNRKGQAALPTAMRSLDALIAVSLTLMPAKGSVRRSLEIAVDLDHPAYDALYVAMAETYSAKLVTADARLLRKVATGPCAHLVIDLQTAATN